MTGTLTRQLPSQFDAERFRRLLELAGPALAPTLLNQLAEDLGSCQRKIDAGTDTLDWTLLRQASHDLIALAGSCGAEALHAMARRLNDLAHLQETTSVAVLHHRLDAELHLLLALIKASADDGEVPT